MQGLMAWRKYQNYYDKQSDQNLWREAFHASSRDGILLPLSSYIVVENEAQRKMLRVKQAEAMGAHAAFDFAETARPADAPTWAVLLVGFGVLMWLKKRWERRLGRG